MISADPASNLVNPLAVRDGDFSLLNPALSPEDNAIQSSLRSEREFLCKEKRDERYDEQSRGQDNHETLH